MGIKKEVLYEIHSIFEALRARKRIFYKLFIDMSYVSDRVDKIVWLATLLGVRCELIKLSEIFSIIKIKNMKSRIFALVSPLPNFEFKNIVGLINQNVSSCLIVLLDGIVDPQNLGAIIRTAYCVNVTGVLVTRNKSCFPISTVSKISAGALEHVNVCLVNSLVNVIKSLKCLGVWIVGMSSYGSTNIFDVDMTLPVAFVMGNENRGLRSLIKRECDFLVSIPLLGKLDSLNVSVAAGIVLYEALRQRRVF